MPVYSHDRSTWQIEIVLASSGFRGDVTMRPAAEDSLSHSALIARTVMKSIAIRESLGYSNRCECQYSREFRTWPSVGNKSSAT